MHGLAAMTGVLGIAAIVVLFMSVWIGVMAIVATVGGWGALARDFPASDHDPEPGKEIRVSSLLFGAGPLTLGSYRNLLTLTIRHGGFDLRIMRLFRFLHPAVSVPWRAVKAYERGKTFGQPFVLLTLSNGQKLRIYGRAATGLAEALSRAAHSHGGPRAPGFAPRA
jgi:hypothetical protein